MSCCAGIQFFVLVLMANALSSESIARALGGSQTSANEWKCKCPAHDDSSPSLWLRDSADGKILAHCFAGCTQDEVVAALRGLDLWPASSGRPFAKTKLPPGVSFLWPPTRVLEKQGAVASDETQKMFSRLFTYRAADGSVLGHVARYDGHGKKDLIPYFKHKEGPHGSFWGSGHAVTSGRPLYGLEVLAGAAKESDYWQLVIVEGEKCADFINSHSSSSRLCAVTWPGGSKSVRKVDFSPVLAWDRILLWPDFDVPGYRAMEDVLCSILGLGFKGELLRIDPKLLLGGCPTVGFDCADLSPDQAAALTITSIEAVALPVVDGEFKRLAPVPPAEPKSDSPIVLPSGDAEIEPASSEKRAPNLVPSSGGFFHTDFGNAERFLAQHAGKVAYVTELGWCLWDGKRFRRDVEGKVRELAAETALSIAADARGERNKYVRRSIISWAQKSHNIPRVNAMLAAAQSKIARPIEDFDADPFLLNCSNGVLNLRTGQLFPHDQKFMQLKLCSVPFEPKAACGKWEAFLRSITVGDMDVVAYLQRALGYSLTGDCREQCMFILTGWGSNGKSVLEETILDIMGDYAGQTSTSLICLSKFGAESNTGQLALLKGARYVEGNEIPRDASLNESRVKEITGQDTVQARLLYRDSFSFRPQFKMWVRCNQRPTVHGQDDGIWRRLKLIPIDAKFTDSEKDPELKSKLMAEAAGILNWCVRGCLDWISGGLREPEVVKREGRTYRDDMDTLGQWFSSCCDEDPAATASSALLYSSYEAWCEKNGEKAITHRTLSCELRDRKFRRSRARDGSRHWIGIHLKSDGSGECADGLQGNLGLN